MIDTMGLATDSTSARANAAIVDELIEWLRAYTTRRLDVARMNERRRLSLKLVSDLGNRGVLGALAPVDVGGLGLRPRDALRLVEQIAALDVALAAFVVLHYTSTMPYETYAQPWLRQHLLPDLARGRILASLAITEPGAGSNVRAIKTRVQQLADGRFRIDGRKTFIGHAEWAAVLTCFARHDDGRISAFAVPSDAEGLRIEPEIETLGLKAVVQNPVVFDGVEVDADHLLGEVGGGLEVADQALSFGRLATGAIAVGAMRRCAQVMDRFATRRRINTGRLLDNAVTQERLVAVHAAVVAVASLLQVLVAEEEAGRRPPGEAFMVLKVAGSELLWRTVDDTVQLLGSRGYDEANGVAALFRDARFLRIGEGPSETLRMQVGAAVAHGEPRLRAFLRECGGPEAEAQMIALAADAMAQDGTGNAEAVYDRLGAAAIWQVLGSAMTRSGVADKMARSWVDQRIAEASRGARHPSAPAFDLAAWSSAVAGHDHAVGTLDDAWPVPQSTRDPYLRKAFFPEAEEARLEQSRLGQPRLDQAAPTGAARPERRFLFRVDVPTDRNHRQFGIPDTWMAPGPLDPTTAVAVQEVAQARGTDLESVLLAAFVAFVARFAGETEVEMLCARVADDAAPCGPLFTDLADEASIDSLIRTVSGAFDSPAWPDPADAIRARPSEGLASNKLVAGGISIAFAAGDVSALHEDAFEGVDLTLVCDRRGREVRLGWKYDPVAFTRETIVRRHANFEVFLLAALSSPATDFRRLELLPAGERELVVDGMNGPVTDPAYHHHTLHGLIEAQVDRTPDAVALETPRYAFTYRQMDERANRLAQTLRAQGLQAGDMVAVSTSRNPAMVIGLLGALKAGARFVILNSDHPADRRAWILEETRARVVVVDPGTRDGVPDTGAAVVVLDAEGASEDGDVPGAGAARPEIVAAPDDIAYVMFTSGSTGRPKGVLIPHRAICNQMLARRDELGMQPDERILQGAAPNFDIAIWELAGPLVFGGRVVQSGDPEFTWDPASIKQMVQDHAITALQIVPSQLTLLLDEMNDGAGASLRYVICGGESLTKPIQQRFFDSAAQGLYNFYGPTEGAIDSTWWRCEPDDPSASAPIGHGTTNRRLYVLDELRQPVPIGVPGELYIGGVGVAAGYLNQPDLTADRFLDDPFCETAGARMYRTGDRVRYRPDGMLEFFGRVDRQIKVRGVRIEPDEIELTLARHPLVSACAVTARPTAAGEKRLVAYLSVRGGEQPSPRDLRAFAQASLPAEMVPSAFVILKSLPKTSTGKVDFKALPPVDWSALETDSGAPLATPVQAQMASIWSDVLGIRVEDVDADFFELGGHSLLAVQVLSRARDAHGVEISISEFFDDPSLGGLASLVEARMATGEATLPEPPGPAARRPVVLSLGPAVGSTPLYLVHPAHGRATSYEHLGSCLDVPVVALGAPAPAGGPPESPGGVPTIEGTARQYADELSRIHRGEGILLGGWSSGGLVAFEMARQLESRGERVRGVVLLDTPGPSGWPSATDDAEILLGFVQEVAARTGATPELRLADLADAGTRLERASAEARSLGGSPTETSTERLQEMLDFARATLLACAAFHPPGRLQAEVALVRAADRSLSPGASDADSVDLGWLDHVQSRLYVLETPGDHVSMMFGAFAQALGRHVGEAVATLGGG